MYFLRLYALQGLQFLALLSIPFISPNSYRLILEGQALPDLAVYAEFSQLVLFLPHYAIVVLVVATMLRLLMEPHYRASMRKVLSLTIVRFGGMFWLGLMLWMLIGLLWAESPLLIVYHLLHWGGAYLLALVLAQLVWQNPRQERYLLLGFVLAALLQSLLAIAQMLKGTAIGFTELGELVWDADNLFNFGEGQVFRAYGLAVHPNILAGFLVISVFALLVFSRLPANKRYAPVWFLAGLVLLGGLLATISRTAIVAIIPTLIIALLKIFPLRRVRVQRSMLIAMAVLVVLVGGIILFTDIEDALVFRFKRVLDDPRGAIIARVFFEFDDTTPVIQDYHPLGTGMGNLMTVIEQRNAGYGGLLLPAHNAYWVVWAELGVIGVTLYVLGGTSVVARIRAGNNVGMVIWGSAFLAIGLINLFDYYFWGDLRSNTLFFWVLGMWWGYAISQERYTPL